VKTSFPIEHLKVVESRLQTAEEQITTTTTSTSSSSNQRDSTSSAVEQTLRRVEATIIDHRDSNKAGLSIQQQKRIPSEIMEGFSSLSRSSDLLGNHRQFR
jgi:hypothetical protein